MARPKSGTNPWYRSGRGWYVELYGKQVKLGHDKDAAFDGWRRLMAAPKPVVSQLVAGVIEGYLD